MDQRNAYGKVNNDGFNNVFDYDKNLDIDILLMGSSHLEGFNTAQNIISQTF